MLYFGKLLFIILIVSAVGFFGFQIIKKSTPENRSNDNDMRGKSNPFSRRYSGGRCEGEGTRIFTHPPMRIEDIGQILPYGIMVDAHVIPTSHGYISPANSNQRGMLILFFL